MGLGENAGFVHIIDFGLAKMSSPLPPSLPTLTPSLPTVIPHLTRDPHRLVRPGYCCALRVLGSTYHSRHWC